MKILRATQRFIDRPWYAPLLGLICAADLVVLVVPLDPLLLSSCLLRPKSWWRVFLCMTLGAVAGAFVVAYFVQVDPSLVHKHFEMILRSPTWRATQHKVHEYGAPGMIIFGLSPCPQIFPVLVGALSGIPAMELAFALGIGRTLKYGTYSFLAANSPALLRQIPFLRKTMDRLVRAE